MIQAAESNCDLRLVYELEENPKDAELEQAVKEVFDRNSVTLSNAVQAILREYPRK
jgi:hypothetical protein